MMAQHPKSLTDVQKAPMQAFLWNSLFETGLIEVDGQHQRLVGLVNQLGQDTHSGDPARIDQALAELADYTVYHFRSEEAIMAAAGVSALHADRHRATHQRFVAQVVEWINRRKAGEDIHLGALIEFLADWLVFHILGDDQSLGRQVLAIQTGVAAEDAYANDQASNDPRTGILLGALRRLYGGLAARNEELVVAQASLTALNATLEKRVDERTAELRQANERLQSEQARSIEAEKMASLGRMVAGFAHEVNTPVGIALGATSHAQELVSELGTLMEQDEVTEEDLNSRMGMLTEAADLATKNLHRAADMVQRFKRTAVDQSCERERVYELAELFEDVERSLRNEFKNTRIRVSWHCPPGLRLFGPAGTVVQLLINLMQNSRIHAFANGQAEGAIDLMAKLVDGQVQIEFADNGVGMPAETLVHVFEPFFTTRRSEGGSGLGLYIAHNLATQALHGSIHCDSALGAGARFTIRFPAYLAPEQTTAS
jgi:hemerythrin-like metal-binding protein